jgi:hypothetical protein
MHLHLATTARRVLGTAFATAILAGSLAGTASAASPAAVNATTNYRDASKTAVLAVYPFGEPRSYLSSFKLRGPRAGWLKSHSLSSGYVAWRVIVQTSPTKTGPWTTVRKTAAMSLLVNDTSVKTFPDRTVKVTPTAGKFYVRTISKLTWYLEDDNGPIASQKHVYTKYGLVPFSGINVEFGDQTVTRSVAPNAW